MSSKYLLNVSIGPVQEFIAEARKTRDLWVGSYLLSRVTFEAMRPILDDFGDDAIVIPHIIESAFYKVNRGHTVSPSNLQFSTLPNHYIAVVDDNSTSIAGLMDKVHKSVHNYWDSLSNKVHSLIDSTVNARFSGWSHLWKEQIEDHFHIFWVAIPIAPDSLNGGYKDVYNAIQELMVERKLTRTFDQWKGSSAFKCPQCGHREVMGPSGNTNEFWDTLSGNNKISFRIKRGEKLCAICLVKRLAEEDDILKGLSKIPFESTSDISSKHFKSVLKGKYAEQKVCDFLADINKLCETIGKKTFSSVDKISGDLLYREGLSAKRLKKEFPAADKEALKIVSEKTRRSLEEICKEYKVSAEKYYAVLLIDGDKIGDIKSGKGQDPFSINNQRDISKKIAQLGNKVMPEIIINNWNGYTVYSGGDDLLAFGPTENCFSTVEELRKAFSDGMGREVTCSASVVIVHHQASLRRALDEARKGLEQAKEVYGRNAIAITIILSSNTFIRGGCKWSLPVNDVQISFIEDFLNPMARLISMNKDGLGVQFIYDILNELPAFYRYNGNKIELSGTSKDMFAAELERLFYRHIPKGSPVHGLQDFTSTLLEVILSLSDPRYLHQLKILHPNARENIESILRILSFIARQNIKES